MSALSLPLLLDPVVRPRSSDTGADRLAHALVELGHTRVMAVTGGAIMEGVDALCSTTLDVRFFATEGGAAWAAMGEARVTGRPGICVVTSGPAATNLLTPMADALRDNVPMVFVTGQVASQALGTDAFQESPICRMADPTTKATFQVTRADQVADVVAQAVAVASTGRPGPVLIDITKDALKGAPGVPASPPREPALLLEPLPLARLDEVATLLRRAQRPVILAGYGLILARGQQALLELLRVCDAPVVHTLPGKAALPTTHPRCTGFVGMHGLYAANWTLHHADLIVALGARFDDRVTGDPAEFAPQATALVQFDIEATQIDKCMADRKVGVVGDLRRTLPALVDALGPDPLRYDPWLEEVARATARVPSRPARRATSSVRVPHLLEVLGEVAARAAGERPVIVTTEIGSHQMWTGQHLPVGTHTAFFTSSGQGAMGAGLPMAIGAKLACPDALVICIAGDGSLRFSAPELETLWAEQIGVKVLCLNNDGYGIVRMWNRRFFGGRESGVVKTTKDWLLTARGNGFSEDRVGRVRHPRELDGALWNALAHDGPHFLEIETPYEDCLPLIPPGTSFEHIILESPCSP